MFALANPENTNTLILAEFAQHEQDLNAAFLGMTFTDRDQEPRHDSDNVEQIEALESSTAQGIAISSSSIDIYRMLEVLSSSSVASPSEEIASRIEALTEASQKLEDFELRAITEPVPA